MNKTLTVNYQDKPCYDIVFTTDFSSLKGEIDKLGFKDRKACIVTDTNVDKLYASEVENALTGLFSKIITYSIPAGESNKNLAEINKIYEVLIKEHFDRHDLMIALGGGVVGDMYGFTAATYLRGISFVQILFLFRWFAFQTKL